MLTIKSKFAKEINKKLYFKLNINILNILLYFLILLTLQQYFKLILTKRYEV